MYITNARNTAREYLDHADSLSDRELARLLSGEPELPTVDAFARWASEAVAQERYGFGARNRHFVIVEPSGLRTHYVLRRHPNASVDEYISVADAIGMKLLRRWPPSRTGTRTVQTILAITGMIGGRKLIVAVENGSSTRLMELEAGRPRQRELESAVSRAFLDESVETDWLYRRREVLGGRAALEVARASEEGFREVLALLPPDAGIE